MKNDETKIVKILERLVEPSVGQSVSRSVDQLVGTSISRSADQLVGTSCMTSRLIDRLISENIDRPD